MASAVARNFYEALINSNAVHSNQADCMESAEIHMLRHTQVLGAVF